MRETEVACLAQVQAEQRLASALLVQKRFRGLLARRGRIGDNGVLLPRGVKNKRLKPMRLKEQKKRDAIAAKEAEEEARDMTSHL